MGGNAHSSSTIFFTSALTTSLSTPNSSRVLSKRVSTSSGVSTTISEAGRNTSTEFPNSDLGTCITCFVDGSYFNTVLFRTLCPRRMRTIIAMRNIPIRAAILTSLLYSCIKKYYLKILHGY